MVVAIVGTFLLVCTLLLKLFAEVHSRKSGAVSSPGPESTSQIRKAPSGSISNNNAAAHKGEFENAMRLVFFFVFLPSLER